MPHKHTPRLNKSTDLLLKKKSFGGEYHVPDDDNIVKGMYESAKREAVDFISKRVLSARDQTLLMRQKMSNQDKQYKAQWRDNNASDDDIFLPKTREEINAVKAYIISVITQLYPVVKMEPYGTSTIMSKFDEDYRRAKLNEAMFTFYWNDIWHANDDVVPRWVLHFLKYPMAIFKVDYYETSWGPDLRLSVKDRAFMYLDPRANIFADQGWIGEQYFLPKSDVYERVDKGDWSLNKTDMDMISSGEYSAFSQMDMARYFGSNASYSGIQEDEMVQVFEYYQFPRMGLGDLFAVIIGGADDDSNGTLVRYGKNPNPYKGNPYIAASYNPDDRPDGDSLADFQEPFQRVLNTFYELREKDVRKNVRAYQFLLDQMVDDQTEQDWKDGNTFVRIAKAFGEQVIAEGKRVDDYISQPQGGTSTGELYKDIDFILNQGQKSAALPDVFRGLNAQPGATLGQVQEQITRASGQYIPIIRQVMRAIERVAEVCTSYFKSSDYYPEERIIRIVGKNNFAGIIDEFSVVSNNVAYKAVSADDMDVDLIFNAVSGADAAVARTLLMTVIERVIGAIGQIPPLFDVLKKEINFVNLFKQLINVNGIDTENLLLTDDEKTAQKQADEQAQQNAIEQQKQLGILQNQLEDMRKQSEARVDAILEQNKQAEITKKQIAVDTSRAAQTVEVDRAKIELEKDLELRNKIQTIVKEFLSEGNLLRLKTDEDKELMDHEASLEKQAIKEGENISVGRKEKNVELNRD